MENKPCVFCGKNLRVKAERKEYFCLDCFDLCRMWNKFTQTTKEKLVSKEIIERMSLFRAQFLLRLFLFAFLSGLIFELCALLSMWVVLLLLIVWLASFFIVLPLVFKGANPLDRKRAEKFIWPFIIIALFSGLIKIEFKMFEGIPGIVFYLIAFCFGFLWIYLNERKLKIKAVKSWEYCLKMPTKER